MIESLKNIDTQVFLYLNGKHNEWWDTIMYWITNKYFWIPFYAILLVLIYKKLQKKTWLIIPIVAILITSSDKTSVLIKKSVERYRPCHNLTIQNQVHLIDGCGGQYGFVSSHAANTFALAMFLSILLKGRINYFTLFMLSWATLVSYSRIYSGVHYPSDILGGALLGILLGYLFSEIYAYTQKIFYNE